jgi:hypothetical protein
MRANRAGSVLVSAAVLHAERAAADPVTVNGFWKDSLGSLN